MLKSLNYNNRQLKTLNKIADKIEALDINMQGLSDDQLREKSLELKERVRNGESLDSVLVEAFAVCREASARILGLKHYKVQLIGGLVLHQGRIAEMKTGEGKTLVATLPAYLNGLSGKGVHIVTCNDYLAERDMLSTKALYEFLGLSVSVIKQSSAAFERKIAYKSDIIYITNSELGFDYLRDNLVKNQEEKVQQQLNYCIVDEVDSILIDEARTPLIISGEGEEPTKMYFIVDCFVKALTEDDYYKDEKQRRIILTDSGIEKAEKMFSLKNFSDVENLELNHYIKQSLTANYMFEKDKDYIVKDGEILIIDEFTGRIGVGRRYSDGLHQAIEAKEGVEIKAESRTLATITYQNFFRMYSKLSGMTGTAKTEETEFREIYSLDVVVVPTNKPIARKDLNDKIYLTEKAKLDAIIKDIKSTHKKQQPVLVGTLSIEKSEILSKRLTEEGLNHQLLNAKNHEIEAEIISRAGELGAITIATNMAGRGTDIKLGEGALDVGGLKVIGTERAENRRIDNQLRGRSGRQGDAGESAFYISLEDDLMRIFGSERIKNILETKGFTENDVIENSFITKQVEAAQKRVEGNNFDIRKDTIKYDDIVNSQRKIIYTEREKVLNGEDFEAQIKYMTSIVVETIVKNELLKEDNSKINKESIKGVYKYLDSTLFHKHKGFLKLEDLEFLGSEREIVEFVKCVCNEVIDGLVNTNKDLLLNHFKGLLLNIVDELWINHVDGLVALKRQVSNVVFKGGNPIIEYQTQSGKLFNELTFEIQHVFIKSVLNTTITIECKE